jgi:hypothetical protein
MLPRPRVSPRLGLGLLGLWALAGCSHELAPLGCLEDLECVAGEMCVEGACVPEKVTACQSDEQCDTGGAERCLAGVCQAAAGATGGTCLATRDCPLDRYCNTAVGQCQALLAGWCRQEAQCTDTSALCSATTSDVPGRCVECLVDGDCQQGTCVNPGSCQSSEGTPIGNDNPLPPGNNNGDPSDPCEVNAWYGDGTCDEFCPQPDPDCAGGGGGGQCTTMSDCWVAPYTIDYTCEQGSCVCDVAWLGSTCSEGFDPAACACSPGGATPPPPSGGLAENESCVLGTGQVLQCATGLDCIYDTDGSGTPLYGGCKRVCSSNNQCGGGQQCALGFLAGGNGICGTPRLEGQTGCQFWEQGNSFCFDASAPTGANSAFLECLNGTCGFVCNYAGNTGASFTCPDNRQCGTSLQTYDGYGIDLAKCQ